MERLLGAVAVTVLLAIGYFVVDMARSRGATRRRAALRHGAGAEIPLRLRGLSSAYPGFWRAGWLEPATAFWRPRGRWGVPVSLAGARVRLAAPATDKDGLPPFAQSDTVLTCVDARGQVFQLASFDAGEAHRVERSLTEAATAYGAPDAGTGPAGGPHPLRWLRNRVPLVGLALRSEEHTFELQSR